MELLASSANTFYAFQSPWLTKLLPSLRYVLSCYVTSCQVTNFADDRDCMTLREPNELIM